VKHSYLYFHDFDISPSLLGAPSLRVVLWSQWDIVDLDLPMALDVLDFGLSNANLTLLDISTCL
jgi:hypothetical protein